MINPRAERTSAPSSRHGWSSSRSASRKGSAHSDGTIIIDHNRKHDPRVVEMHQHTRSLEEENLKLREHVFELSAKNDQLEQELQYLQESRFQRMPDARYTPIEDSKIQHELETLRASVTRTGKRYGLTKVDRSSFKSRNDLQDLFEAVTDVASTAGGLSDSVALLEVMEQDAALPRLLFTAMLSWFVHHDFIQDPFFFASEDNEDDSTDWADFLSDALMNGCKSKLASALPDRLCQLTRSANLLQANVWRSDTLRHLFPSNDTDRGSQRLHEQGDALLRQAARSAAVTFAQGPARLLLHEMSDAAAKSYQDELVCLFDKAARLSVMLWRERLAFECHYLHDLATQRFSIDGREMQAHPRHLLDDPTDHRLDGRRVQIVVHPSVVGLGTHDGDRYQTTSKVLVKAVVCLDEASGDDEQGANSTRAEGIPAMPVPTIDRASFVRSPPPLPMYELDTAQDESDRWWSLSSRKEKKKKKRPT